MKGNEKTHIQPLTTRKKETVLSQSSHKILSTSNCGYTDKKRCKYESVVRENEAVEGFYLQFLASFYLFLRRAGLIVSVFIYYN